MKDKSTKVIINSKGDFTGESDELKELAKLMNDEEVSLNKHFIWAQKRIKELNQDRKADIMDYEMKMMDREIYGREIGKEAERRAGVKKLIIFFVKKDYSDSDIFDNIKEIYGQYFSDDELKQFIAEAKNGPLQEA